MAAAEKVKAQPAPIVPVAAPPAPPAAPPEAGQGPVVRALSYVTLRDFNAMIGHSFQKFKLGQRFNGETEAYMVGELLKQGAPIQVEGERIMDTCPKCGHVYACKEG